MKSKATDQHAEGFSLIELVLVVMIIGVISAIALPRFSQASARQRLNSAAQRLIADIDLVRTRANTASQTITLTFNTTNASYQVDAVAGDAFAVQFDESPYGVDILDADFGGRAYVQFNAYGIPEETGKIQLGSAAGNVTIYLTESGEATR